MKDKKKKQALRAAILVGFMVTLIATSFGVIFAQVQRRAIAENEITSGVIKVTLINQNKSGEDMPKLITNIVPGDTLSNVVKIKNDCNYDEYIRVSLYKKIYDSKEEQMELDAEKATFLFNNSDWTYQDGYYYYNSKLKPMEISSPLYDGIYLDTSMDNNYKHACLDIEITVEAVQSVNNGATPFVAEGWEVVA